MAEITASLVKELRDKTDAGMMDCKKALAETNGDLEAAVDLLRKKGLVKAAKKSSRVAAEGLVAVATKGKEGALVEVNSETDFVARNELFQKFVLKAATVALELKGNIEAIQNQLSEELTQLIATIGENMNIRRVEFLSVENGVVASYMHNTIAPNLGTIGVLVAMEDASGADLATVGKHIAMHVAASQPVCVDVADVPAEMVEHERSIYAEQVAQSGKPADIAAKMIEGRINKYYEEIVLLKQPFVMDPAKKVEAVLAESSKAAKLKKFVRFTLGEGVEKEACDFAAEVASMAGKK
jgi:elongation factor Ts